MRFNWKCPECGEYKWCGRECEHKPVRFGESIDLVPEVTYSMWRAPKPKFDRAAHMAKMRERRRFLREHGQ